MAAGETNDSLKKKVFSYLLKVSTEAALRRPIRRAFHSVGATTSKA